MTKILLIEDNLEMRENTAEILELANYEVFTAKNGKVGVELAKKHKPDLIICDIMMPELDGYGVLFLLSKDPQTSGIPFIFLTAKAEKSDIRKGMNLGADDYLTKPFEEMELLNAVEGRLRKTEALKRKYNQNTSGINEFIEDASALANLEELTGNRKQRSYKKKDIIFHEGDHPNYLYFINKGKVKTLKMNEEGKEYITGLHQQGDFIGYMALLEDVEFTESAEAMEDTEIYLIPKQDFLALINKNRDVAHKFIKLMSNNIVEKEKQLLSLAYNTVRKRVAESLLMLHDKYNKNGNGQLIAISRDDLASIVGTSTESVIRTLSDFKDEKLIEISGRNIKILDRHKLEGIW